MGPIREQVALPPAASVPTVHRACRHDPGPQAGLGMGATREDLEEADRHLKPAFCPESEPPTSTPAPLGISLTL